MFYNRMVDVMRWLEAIEFEEFRTQILDETCDRIYQENVMRTVLIEQHEYG